MYLILNILQCWIDLIWGHVSCFPSVLFNCREFFLHTNQINKFETEKRFLDEIFSTLQYEYYNVRMDIKWGVYHKCTVVESFQSWLDWIWLEYVADTLV